MVPSLSRDRGLFNDAEDIGFAHEEIFVVAFVELYLVVPAGIEINFLSRLHARRDEISFLPEATGSDRHDETCLRLFLLRGVGNDDARRRLLFAHVETLHEYAIRKRLEGNFRILVFFHIETN